MLRKKMSEQSFNYTNPIDETANAESVMTIKLVSLVGAQLIEAHSLNEMIQKLNLLTDNPERLLFLASAIEPYLFTSASLIEFLNITPSVKTRISMICMIAPRLVDPKAQQDYFVGLFRFSAEKDIVEKALKERAQVVNAGIFQVNCLDSSAPIVNTSEAPTNRNAKSGNPLFSGSKSRGSGMFGKLLGNKTATETKTVSNDITDPLSKPTLCNELLSNSTNSCNSVSLQNHVVYANKEFAQKPVLKKSGSKFLRRMSSGMNILTKSISSSHDLDATSVANTTASVATTSSDNTAVSVHSGSNTTNITPERAVSVDSQEATIMWLTDSASKGIGADNNNDDNGFSANNVDALNSETASSSVSMHNELSSHHSNNSVFNVDRMMYDLRIVATTTGSSGMNNNNNNSSSEDNSDKASLHSMQSYQSMQSQQQQQSMQIHGKKVHKRPSLTAMLGMSSNNILKKKHSSSSLHHMQLDGSISSEFSRIQDNWTKRCMMGTAHNTGTTTIATTTTIVISQQQVQQQQPLSKEVAAEFKKRIANSSSMIDTSKLKPKLNLSECGLTDYQVIILMEELAVRPVIDKLDLSGNYITNEGARCIRGLLTSQVQLAAQLTTDRLTRLRATFLGEVTLKKNRSPTTGSGSSIDKELLEEIHTLCLALCQVNAQNCIYQLYLDHASPDFIDSSLLISMWTDIIGKKPDRNESFALTAAVTSSAEGLAYERVEALLLDGCSRKGVLHSLSKDQSTTVHNIETAAAVTATATTVPEVTMQQDHNSDDCIVSSVSFDNNNGNDNANAVLDVDTHDSAAVLVTNNTIFITTDKECIDDSIVSSTAMLSTDSKSNCISNQTQNTVTGNICSSSSNSDKNRLQTISENDRDDSDEMDESSTQHMKKDRSNIPCDGDDDDDASSSNDQNIILIPYQNKEDNDTLNTVVRVEQDDYNQLQYAASSNENIDAVTSSNNDEIIGDGENEPCEYNDHPDDNSTKRNEICNNIEYISAEVIESDYSPVERDIVVNQGNSSSNSSGGSNIAMKLEEGATMSTTKEEEKEEILIENVNDNYYDREEHVIIETDKNTNYKLSVNDNYYDREEQVIIETNTKDQEENSNCKLFNYKEKENDDTSRALSATTHESQDSVISIAVNETTDNNIIDSPDINVNNEDTPTSEYCYNSNNNNNITDENQLERDNTNILSTAAVETIASSLLSSSSSNNSEENNLTIENQTQEQCMPELDAISEEENGQLSRSDLKMVGNVATMCDIGTVDGNDNNMTSATPYSAHVISTTESLSVTSKTENTTASSSIESPTVFSAPSIAMLLPSADASKIVQTQYLNTMAAIAKEIASKSLSLKTTKHSSDDIIFRHTQDTPDATASTAVVAVTSVSQAKQRILDMMAAKKAKQNEEDQLRVERATAAKTRKLNRFDINNHNDSSSDSITSQEKLTQTSNVDKASDTRAMIVPEPVIIMVPKSAADIIPVTSEDTDDKLLLTNIVKESFERSEEEYNLPQQQQTSSSSNSNINNTNSNAISTNSVFDEQFVNPVLSETAINAKLLASAISEAKSIVKQEQQQQLIGIDATTTISNNHNASAQAAYDEDDKELINFINEQQQEEASILMTSKFLAARHINVSKSSSSVTSKLAAEQQQLSSTTVIDIDAIVAGSMLGASSRIGGQQQQQQQHSVSPSSPTATTISSDGLQHQMRHSPALSVTSLASASITNTTATATATGQSRAISPANSTASSSASSTYYRVPHLHHNNNRCVTPVRDTLTSTTRAAVGSMKRSHSTGGLSKATLSSSSSRNSSNTFMSLTKCSNSPSNAVVFAVKPVATPLSARGIAALERHALSRSPARTRSLSTSALNTNIIDRGGSTSPTAVISTIARTSAGKATGISKHSHHQTDYISYDNDDDDDDGYYSHECGGSICSSKSVTNLSDKFVIHLSDSSSDDDFPASNNNKNNHNKQKYYKDNDISGRSNHYLDSDLKFSIDLELSHLLLSPNSSFRLHKPRHGTSSATNQHDNNSSSSSSSTSFARSLTAATASCLHSVAGIAKRKFTLLEKELLAAALPHCRDEDDISNSSSSSLARRHHSAIPISYSLDDEHKPHHRHRPCYDKHGRRIVKSKHNAKISSTSGHDKDVIHPTTHSVLDSSSSSANITHHPVHHNLTGTSFDIISQNITDLSADSSMIEYLDRSQCGIIKSLRLRDNLLSVDSLKNMRLQNRFKSLTELDMGYNILHGSVSLPTLFPYSLLKLDLSNNNITDFASILTCVHLEELNLSYNKIETIDTIPPRLVRFDISNNFIWSAVCLRVLALSPGLLNLQVESNPVILLVPRWKVIVRSVLTKLQFLNGQQLFVATATPSSSSFERYADSSYAYSATGTNRLSAQEQRLLDKQRSDQYILHRKEMEVLRLLDERKSVTDAAALKCSEETLQKLSTRLSEPKYKPVTNKSTKKRRSQQTTTFTTTARHVCDPIPANTAVTGWNGKFSSDNRRSFDDIGKRTAANNNSNIKGNQLQSKYKNSNEDFNSSSNNSIASSLQNTPLAAAASNSTSISVSNAMPVLVYWMHSAYDILQGANILIQNIREVVGEACSNNNSNSSTISKYDIASFQQNLRKLRFELCDPLPLDVKLAINSISPSSSTSSSSFFFASDSIINIRKFEFLSSSSSPSEWIDCVYYLQQQVHHHNIFLRQLDGAMSFTASSSNNSRESTSQASSSSFASAFHILMQSNVGQLVTSYQPITNLKNIKPPTVLNYDVNENDSSLFTSLSSHTNIAPHTGRKDSKKTSKKSIYEIQLQRQQRRSPKQYTPLFPQHQQHVDEHAYNNSNNYGNNSEFIYQVNNNCGSNPTYDSTVVEEYNDSTATTKTHNEILNSSTSTQLSTENILSAWLTSTTLSEGLSHAATLFLHVVDLAASDADITANTVSQFSKDLRSTPLPQLEYLPLEIKTAIEDHAKTTISSDNDNGSNSDSDTPLLISVQQMRRKFQYFNTFFIQIESTLQLCAATENKVKFHNAFHILMQSPIGSAVNEYLFHLYQPVDHFQNHLKENFSNDKHDIVLSPTTVSDQSVTAPVPTKRIDDVTTATMTMSALPSSSSPSIILIQDWLSRSDVVLAASKDLLKMAIDFAIRRKCNDNNSYSSSSNNNYSLTSQDVNVYQMAYASLQRTSSTVYSYTTNNNSTSSSNSSSGTTMESSCMPIPNSIQTALNQLLQYSVESNNDNTLSTNNVSQLSSQLIKAVDVRCSRLSDYHQLFQQINSIMTMQCLGTDADGLNYSVVIDDIMMRSDLGCRVRKLEGIVYNCKERPVIATTELATPFDHNDDDDDITKSNNTSIADWLLQSEIALGKAAVLLNTIIDHVTTLSEDGIISHSTIAVMQSEIKELQMSVCLHTLPVLKKQQLKDNQDSSCSITTADDDDVDDIEAKLNIFIELFCKINQSLQFCRSAKLGQNHNFRLLFDDIMTSEIGQTVNESAFYIYEPLERDN